MRWLIVGGTGLLGDAIIKVRTSDPAVEVVATWNTTTPSNDAATWHRLDMTHESAIAELFAEIGPDVVINAAYDKSPEHMQATTADAPGVLARHAALTGARFLQVSSDAIFDGPPGHLHTEADPPNPCNDYGRAKASSEQVVQEAGGLIARSSLLYARGRVEPMSTMVAQAAAGEDITFFTDEFRCPALVDDVAAAVCELVMLASPPRVIHLGGADVVDRFTFARLLGASRGIDVDRLVGLPTPPGVVRAKNAAMSNELAKSVLSKPIPGVREHLA